MHEVEFSEIIKDCDMKVGRCKQIKARHGHIKSRVQNLHVRKICIRMQICPCVLPYAKFAHMQKLENMSAHKIQSLSEQFSRRQCI